MVIKIRRMRGVGEHDMHAQPRNTYKVLEDMPEEKETTWKIA